MIFQVSVPCASLFKTVTVRCGHCTNLLPVNVNVRGLLLPSANQFHLGHSFYSPSHNLLVIKEVFCFSYLPFFHISWMEDKFMHMPYCGNCLFLLEILCLWRMTMQEEIPNPSPNFLIDQTNSSNDFSVTSRTTPSELPRPPLINRREISIPIF